MPDDSPTPPDETYPLVLTARQRSVLVDETQLAEHLKQRFRDQPNPRKGVPLTGDELIQIGDGAFAILDQARGAEARVFSEILNRINDALDDLEARAIAAQRALLPLTNKVYQIKVTLRAIEPRIWRRFLILDGTLADLHDAIQDIMGWEDAHLHEFNIDKRRFGIPEDDGGLGVFFDVPDIEDEGAVLISQFAPSGRKQTKIMYTYDFGDDWEHDVVIEKVLDPDPALTYPICIEGARACPPEDCGGPWGYAVFVEAVTVPEHPSHEERLEWVGIAFDPEEFSVEKTNANIQNRRPAS